MQCQKCKAHGPVTKASFCGVVGMLFTWEFFSTHSELCASCLRRQFLDYTLTSLALGWWSVISLLITPFVLGYNLVSFAACEIELLVVASRAPRNLGHQGLVGELQ